jgi:hypothetical protein
VQRFRLSGIELAAVADRLAESSRRSRHATGGYGDEQSDERES